MSHTYLELYLQYATEFFEISHLELHTVYVHKLHSIICYSHTIFSFANMQQKYLK